MQKSGCQWRGGSAHAQLFFLWGSGTEQVLPSCRNKGWEFWTKSSEEFSDWQDAKEGIGEWMNGEGKTSFMRWVHLPRVRLHVGKRRVRAGAWSGCEELSTHSMFSTFPLCLLWNLSFWDILTFSLKVTITLANASIKNKILIHDFTWMCDLTWIFIPTQTLIFIF